MAYTSPTADFVTSSLSGAITAAATSATIGAGLNIPATLGILQIDYDSALAVGVDYGPETISYASYNSGTGALSGITRGIAGTTGVAHNNVASVQSGMSSAYLQQSPQYDTWNAGGALTWASTDGPTFTATLAGDSTTAIYPGVRVKATQTQAIQNYWSFDATSADAKGGATMTDIGTPTYAAGQIGAKALTLNGTDQALAITDAAAFKPTDNFTIGAWIKCTDATNANTIFQSYSDNTNAQGIRFGTVITTGLMVYRVGSGSADDTANTYGTTVVTDNAFHYVVLSVRNNYAQIYVDGKLDGSGYVTTPTYNATNYVRIGALNVAGANVASNWFKGQIDDLFIAAYALDEQTIAAKYAAATAQGTGDLTLTKYFLCTASSYSAPNTTLTLYGGTDHSLMNAAITSPYYSTQKAPYGFPLKEHKWTVEYQSTTEDGVTGPTGTYKNYANAILSVPIGNWRVGYIAVIDCIKGVSTVCDNYTTLSTSATAETDKAMTVWAFFNGASASYVYAVPVHMKKSYAISTKTAFYLNAKTGQSSTGLTLRGGQAMTRIFAISTLL